MASINEQEWFRTWFDSPYYSVLYKNRGHEEAAAFIDSLVQKLDIEEGARVLDLACGMGRHSVQLHQKGFKVVGLDLSNNSIASAKNFEKEGLHFETGDMRNFNLDLKFNAIFNLFTSFGYFETFEDNKRVLSNVYSHLKDEGFFVLDYFNALKVQSELIPFETKNFENIDFEISKKIEQDQIVKNIQFKAEGRDFDFTEKVQLIMPHLFETLLDQAGFQILHTFGNYHLEAFDALKSDRFITISKKK